MLAGVITAATSWCIVPSAHADDSVLCRITDPRLQEISGLAYSTVQPGVLWTHNDSGDGARLYALDANTCKVLGVLRIDGVPGQDIEAMAAGVNAKGDPVLWVGDIGDNTGHRSTVSIYEVPEPKAYSGRVSAKRYLLHYSEPQDAEALLADPTGPRLWVITKGILGGSLFQVPLPLSERYPTGLRKIGDEGGFVTDAAVAPDGSRYVVRDYTEARVYAGLPPGPVITRVPLPDQVQGEAITWAPDGRALVIASESDDRIIRVELPQEAWMETAGGAPTPTPTTSATPAPSRTKASEKAKEGPLTKAIEPVDTLGQFAVIALAAGAVTFIIAALAVVVVLIVRDRRRR